MILTNYLYNLKSNIKIEQTWYIKKQIQLSCRVFCMSHILFKIKLMETSLNIILRILKALKVLLWPNILLLFNIISVLYGQNILLILMILFCSKSYLYSVCVQNIYSVYFSFASIYFNDEVHFRYKNIAVFILAVCCLELLSDLNCTGKCLLQW